MFLRRKLCQESHACLMALAKQCVPAKEPPASSIWRKACFLAKQRAKEPLLVVIVSRTQPASKPKTTEWKGPSPYAKPQHSPARRTAPAWKGVPPHAKPQHSRNSKKPHMVEHAEGRGSLGSLNPKRRSVQRVGAALSALGGKCEAGRPFRPPLSTALDRQARAARLP